MELLLTIICYCEIVFGILGFFAGMFYTVAAEKFDIYQQYEKDEEYYRLEKSVKVLKTLSIVSLCVLGVCVISIFVIGNFL